MAKEIQNDYDNNPFLNAKREWLERYGSYIRQTRNWQIAAFLSICIAFISVLFLGYMGTQNKLIPYIVEVDKLGNTANVGVVATTDLKNPSVVKYSLNTFIFSWRTIWGNADTQKKFILDAYNYLKPQSAAYAQTNEHFKNNNPFNRKEKVKIKIKSIVPQNITTWQVEWEELVTNIAETEKLSEKTYKGLFQIEQITPTTEEEIRKNPLGVFISDYNYAPIL